MGSVLNQTSPFTLGSTSPFIIRGKPELLCHIPHIPKLSSDAARTRENTDSCSTYIFSFSDQGTKPEDMKIHFSAFFYKTVSDVSSLWPFFLKPLFMRPLSLCNFRNFDGQAWERKKEEEKWRGKLSSGIYPHSAIPNSAPWNFLRNGLFFFWWPSSIYFY